MSPETKNNFTRLISVPFWRVFCGVIWSLALGCCLAGVVNAESLEESIVTAYRFNNEINAGREAVQGSKHSASGDFSSVIYPTISLSGNVRSADNGRIDVRHGSSSLAAWEYDSDISARVSYNLFDGFAGFNKFKSSAALWRAKGHLLNATQQSVITRVVNEYVAYLRDSLLVKSAEDELGVYEHQIGNLEIRLRHNDITKTDLLQTQVNSDSTEIRLREYRQSLNASKNRLAALVTREVDPTDSLEDLVGLVETYLRDNFNGSFSNLASDSEALLVSHPRVRYSKEQAIKSKYLKDTSYGSFFPKVELNAFAGYRLNQNSLVKEIYNPSGAAITFRYDISSFGRDYSEYKSKVKDYTESIFQLKQATVDLRAKMTSSIENFELKTRNLKLYRDAHANAHKMYDSAVNELSGGEKDNFQMLYFVNLLFSRKNEMIRAQYDYVHAFYQMMENCGMLQELSQAVIPVSVGVGEIGRVDYLSSSGSSGSLGDGQAPDPEAAPYVKKDLDRVFRGGSPAVGLGNLISARDKSDDSLYVDRGEMVREFEGRSVKRGDMYNSTEQGMTFKDTPISPSGKNASHKASLGDILMSHAMFGRAGSDRRPKAGIVEGGSDRQVAVSGGGEEGRRVTSVGAGDSSAESVEIVDWKEGLGREVDIAWVGSGDVETANLGSDVLVTTEKSLGFADDGRGFVSGFDSSGAKEPPGAKEDLEVGGVSGEVDMCVDYGFYDGLGSVGIFGIASRRFEDGGVVSEVLDSGTKRMSGSREILLFRSPLISGDGPRSENALDFAGFENGSEVLSSGVEAASGVELVEGSSSRKRVPYVESSGSTGVVGSVERFGAQEVLDFRSGVNGSGYGYGNGGANGGSVKGQSNSSGYGGYSSRGRPSGYGGYSSRGRPSGYGGYSSGGRPSGYGGYSSGGAYASEVRR